MLSPLLVSAGAILGLPGALMAILGGWTAEAFVAYFAGLLLMALGSGMGAFFGNRQSSPSHPLRIIGLGLASFGSALGLAVLVLGYIRVFPAGLTVYDDLGLVALWLALLGVGFLTSIGFRTGASKDQHNPH
jgi:hypothetical protein